MKKLLLCSFMFLSLIVKAQEFEVNGINYRIIKKGGIVEVTKKSSGKYEGDIVLPNSVEYDGNSYDVAKIGDYSFNECEELTSITIPNGVDAIGNYVFVGCEKLKSVEIPNSVTSIGNSTFEECKNLESVILPNNLESISDDLFQWCSSLKTIIIPNSVKHIGRNAFMLCESLTQLIIPDSVTEIEWSAFSDCYSLTSIVLPNNIEELPNYVLASCRSLKSITLPENIKIIDNCAFFACLNLSEIVIGSNVEYISDGAFEACENLTKVVCYAPIIKHIHKNAFRNSYIEYATLYVPEGSVDAYKTTEPWSKFGTILPIDETAIHSIEVDKSPIDIYTINGRMVTSPQRGLNIYRMSDGSTKKVLMK